MSARWQLPQLYQICLQLQTPRPPTSLGGLILMTSRLVFDRFDVEQLVVIFNLITVHISDFDEAKSCPAYGVHDQSFHSNVPILPMSLLHI